MHANIGMMDGAMRVLIGATLIGLAAFGTVSAWGYLGVIPFATGLLRRCPAYRLFGVSTCGMERR